MSVDMERLARDAINVQDACNLSGVTRSFAQAMSDLRRIIPDKGTDFYNTHPIAIMYSDKIASLTGSNTKLAFADAYDFCRKYVGN